MLSPKQQIRKQQILMASDINTDAEDLYSLSQVDHEDVQVAVAKNASTTPDVLMALNKAAYSTTVLEAIALHPHCPTPLFEVLSRNQHIRVRKAVGTARKCPESILHFLAHDEDIQVTSAIAKNPSATPATLSILAANKSSSLRSSVGANISCPIELQKKLANDDEWWVRHGVAANQSCPPDLLSQLANDSMGTVRYSCAGNPACPTHILVRFYAEPDKSIRLAVANNASTPVGLVIALASNDVSEEVRKRSVEIITTKTADDWVQAVNNGLTLSQACEGSPGLTLGDALLSAGLTDIFQSIQSTELAFRIKGHSDKANASLPGPSNAANKLWM